MKSTKADIERKIKVIASVNRDDLGPHEKEEICALKESREKLMATEKYIAGNLPFFFKEILEIETVSLVWKLIRIRIRIRTFMLAIKGPQGAYILMVRVNKYKQ